MNQIIEKDQEITINDRIRTLICELGKNVTSFSKEIDVTQSGMQSIVNGRTNPGYDTIHKIVTTKFRKRDRLVEVDANWLIKGEGDIFLLSGDDDSEGFRENILKRMEEIERKINKP